MFQAFLSSLSHCFDSAGIVILLKGENRSQRKSESQDEYLDRFRHTGVNNRFAILEWSLATLIFQRQTVVVQHTVFPPHRLPLFPFKVKC